MSQSPQQGKIGKAAHSTPPNSHGTTGAKVNVGSLRTSGDGQPIKSNPNVGGSFTEPPGNFGTTSHTQGRAATLEGFGTKKGDAGGNHTRPSSPGDMHNNAFGSKSGKGAGKMAGRMNNDD